ncbi:MAG: hypothetical protein ABIS45_02720 [Burkholderiales bacterium]
MKSLFNSAPVKVKALAGPSGPQLARTSFDYRRIQRSRPTARWRVFEQMRIF